MIFEVQTLIFRNGSGECVVTGRVDTAIEEMVQAVLSHLRYNSVYYHLPSGLFQNNDLHVHFTEGSYLKEGTSAGLAVAIGIMAELFKMKSKNLSLLATGEIDLYGGILEIGGMQKKLRYFSNSTKFDYFMAPAVNVSRSSNRIIGFNNLFEVYGWLKSVK